MMKELTTRLRAWARSLKRETIALYLAARDSRTPWYAKVVAGCVVAYARSPIDLIPDFVPLLGYLDDVVLLPLGIALALRLVPPEVLAETRLLAAESSSRPVSRSGMVAIVVIWLLLGALALVWAWRVLAA
jgi:uncharacterized membrane protein YkvA (DUF1232 family)